MNLFKSILYKLRGEVPTKELVARGMKVGTNFHRMNGVWIDPGHCWLITIGDNVTLAPKVTILAHDASPQAFLQVTKIGNVTIGNNVFIGANSTILPGVTIGSNVIVGAGSVVTKDIPDNMVFAGNPAVLIMSIDKYIAKVKSIKKEYGRQYLFPLINKDKKEEMREYLYQNRFASLVRKN